MTAKKKENTNVELLVLSAIIHDEKYARKVIPHIKAEYFEKKDDRTIYELIYSYFNNYNKVPSKEAVEIDISKSEALPSEELFKSAEQKIEKIFSDKAKKTIQNLSFDWLVDVTKEHCLDSSLYNGIMEAVSIIDGSNKQLTKTAIPKILQDALSVSFDTRIGHDYLEDYDARFDHYHKKEEKIPLPLDALNKITKGGLPRKTLNIMIAPTGVGKTFFLTYSSAHMLMQGYNVLYITLEMDEESIGERVDAALLDCPIDQLHLYQRETFANRIKGLKTKTTGRLIIQQYPPGSANVAHFRFLLEELRMKKNFVPDAIVIDYLNLCSSSRIRSRDNSYTYVKSIAEEVRGLGIERNATILTASQSNRNAQNASDYDLNEVSESHGLSMTADWMIGAISTDELEKMNQLRIKQLKNRYGPMTPKSFLVGISRAKMQMFNADSISSPNTTTKTTTENNTMKNTQQQKLPSSKKRNTLKF